MVTEEITEEIFVNEKGENLIIKIGEDGTICINDFSESETEGYKLLEGLENSGFELVLTEKDGRAELLKDLGIKKEVPFEGKLFVDSCCG